MALSSLTCDIVIGGDIFRTTDTNMSGPLRMVCGEWGGLEIDSSSSAGTVRLYGAITGDLHGSDPLTGDPLPGIVNVDRVGRFDIDGHLKNELDVPAPMDGVPPVFAINIGGSITADGKVILRTGDITRVEVGGNVEQPAGDPGNFPIEQTSIAAAAGNITRLTVGGDLRGDVVARPTGIDDDGRIGTIEVTGHIGRAYTLGDFGDPDANDDFPEMVGALYNQDVLRIEASTGINLITAASMTCFIEADRDAGFGKSAGCLEEIRTTNGGSFKGSIMAGGINDNEFPLVLDPAVIRGDIQGDFRGRFNIGFTADRNGRMSGTFKIGGSMLPLVMPEDLTADGLPDTPDDGFYFPESNDWLTGQVIINANNNSGVWTATTDFDGTSLSSNYYTNLPSAVGGGSIGLAPFRMHQAACTPTHNNMSQTTVLETDFDSTSDATEVVIRNYGPVKGLGALPLSSVLKIDMEVPSDPCHWMAMGDFFTIDYLRDGSGNILENRRAIAIRPSGVMPKAATYRVRIVQDGDTEDNLLVSAEVTGEPPVVWPVSCGDEPFESTQAYVFRVLADCDTNGTADAVQIAGNSSLDLDLDGVLDSCERDDYCCDTNESGFVTADDIFAFLDLWFAQNGQTGSGLSADFNQSNSVTADDIFAFLDCWFAMNGLTCP